MAFLLVIVVCLLLAVTVSAQPNTEQKTAFSMSPKNLTYMADDGEENLSTTLLCIADNAYQIDWIVNDSEINDDHQHMYQSTVVSSLQFDISVGDSVEVVCRAWPSDRSNHVDSVPAVISFQSCNCGIPDPQSGAELSGNTTSTLPTHAYPAWLFWTSIVLNIGFIIAFLVIIIILIYWRVNRQSNRPVQRISPDGGEDIVEQDGPRQQNRGANIRRRPGQRQ